jgi:hypothetical protein
VIDDIPPGGGTAGPDGQHDVRVRVLTAMPGADDVERYGSTEQALREAS